LSWDPDTTFQFVIEPDEELWSAMVSWFLHFASCTEAPVLVSALRINAHTHGDDASLPMRWLATPSASCIHAPLAPGTMPCSWMPGGFS